MKLLTKDCEAEYREFLEKNERSNFQQTIEWGKVKESWENEIIIVQDNNKKIVASISVLIRKIPIFGNMIYAPRRACVRYS